MVIAALADSGHTRLALHYSEYRLRHEMRRKQNSTDKRILALLRHDSEIAKQENANKDPIINSTMRDYLASEVSDDICRSGHGEPCGCCLFFWRRRDEVLANPERTL